MKTIYDARYIRMMADLKSVRFERGLTQVQVCGELGRSSSWLAKIENCEIRMDVLNFLQLCRVYRVSAGEFVSRHELVVCPDSKREE